MKTITSLPDLNADAPLAALRGKPPSRVDCENHVIYGVALIQAGPLNEGDARPWFIDDKSLAQVLELASKPVKGMKARWTHPNMSRDGMGTYLGRFKDARLSEDKQTVEADLHLSALAFKGDGRGGYVEEMAETDPEAFGVSLFPILDRAAMERDAKGGDIQPMRFRRVIAGDVVDEPAATQGGFFGGKLSIATAPGYATEVLNQLFADAPAEVIRARTDAFLTSYLAERFGGSKPVESEIEMAEKNESPQAITLEAVNAAVAAALKTQAEAFEVKLAAMAAKPEAPKVPTTEEIEHRGALRASGIMAAAQMSGLADYAELSAKAITEGLSVDAFKAQLYDRALKNGGLSSDAGQKPSDPNAKYVTEYLSQKEAYESVGLSQAEYIVTRRVEDGLEKLETKSA